MEGEQIDAIVRWLAVFGEGDNAFVDNPTLLLDGQVLAKVYNILDGGNDPININMLKQISNLDDWVSILLNMRQISGKVMNAIKPNDLSIDPTALAKKKDQGELLKLLKCFIFYSLKSTNKKISIQNIRSLDKSIQSVIQSIIQEFTAKTETEAPSSPVPQTPPSSPAKPSAPADDGSAEKIAALDKEIQELTARKSQVDKEIEQAERQLQIQAAPGKSEELLNDAKRRHQTAKDKLEKLRKKLEETEETLNASRGELDELRKQKQKLLNPDQVQTPERSNTELKQQLEKLQREIIADLSNDTKTAALIERNPPKTNDDYINLLNIRSLETEYSALTKELQSMQTQEKLHEAELTALSQNLNNQNKKAALTLKKRIQQLNAEIDQSPIGEAKRMSMKYLRVIKKLEGEVENLAANCSDMEVEELTKQLQIMAARKATEGDLLARKQAFMQATAEQCDVRLQRLKLNVDLMMHSARITRWKNCFQTPQQQQSQK